MRILLILVVVLLVSAPTHADLASVRTALFGGDPAAALKLAKTSDITALLALGEAYLTGRGVDRDPATAALWITKAAEAGIPRVGDDEAAGIVQVAEYLAFVGDSGAHDRSSLVGSDRGTLPETAQDVIPQIVDSSYAP
jgi:hypothetical protein